jgi:putative tryptophan/tyrosine transport system substrate-binding protein
MRRREFLNFASAAAAWQLAGRAWADDRVPRIGVLLVNTAEQERAFFGDDPFGLRDLGYIEGKTIRIERRFADGRPERLPALAAELVALNVDRIIAGGEGVRAAHSATTITPIVMASGPDVVALGYAASLAHSGGNVTGTSFSIFEVFAKRMELLKQVAPSITSIGMLIQPGGAKDQAFMDVVVSVAKYLKAELRLIEFSGKNYADALSGAGQIEGLVIVDTGQFQGDAAIIAATANERRLPTAASPLSARAGALIGYGVSFADLFRRAGVFADKIIKGSKPCDIPIERGRSSSLSSISRLLAHSGSTFRRPCLPPRMR